VNKQQQQWQAAEINAITAPSSYASYNDYLKNMIKYFNLDNPAPYVTARSWVMTNLDTGEVLFAKQDKEKRQVASLTKIMTFWCVH
jgi:D-alanyl-D-alanine carboxypeptidase